jgi:two-component system, cell cycle sensor histidine kinase and response regulator CckA
VHCTFAKHSNLAAWLAPMPCNDATRGSMSWRRLSLPEACLMTVVVVAAATLVRLAINPFLLGTQFPTFFLAAIIATFLGGVCVGLLSVALSTLSAWFFIQPPLYSFTLDPGTAYALITFVAVAAVMVFIIGSLRAASLAIEEGVGREVVLTERTRIADEPRLWSDVFHDAPFGISVVDPASNTIRFANQAFASLRRMSVDEVQGTSVFDMHPPAEHERIAELQAASDRVGQIDYEADCIRKDGAIFAAHIYSTSVRRGDSAVLYRIRTVRDITIQRRLEAELDQSARLEAVGQLTAGIAHDFNNLLQGIMANLELVDDDLDVPPATREYVGTAVRLAEQAGELTHSLLSFARKQLLKPNEVDLDDFLGRFQRLLSRTLDPRVRIEVVTEPGRAPVWVDARHLQSALLNLAINARDAMPAGGDLRIEAFSNRAAAASEPAGRGADAEGFVSRRHRPPDRCAVIRLTDTGTGIAPKDLARVCEPFFSTKGLDGTGLGLSMVHGFAKQSGGDLRISSDVGKGTSVEVWLPLVSAQAVPAPASARQ